MRPHPRGREGQGRGGAPQSEAPRVPPHPPHPTPRAPDPPSALSSPPRKVQRTDLVGKRMMKTFGGHGTFVGDIVSYDPETGCYQQVTYEDGDKEGLSRASVQAGVRRFQAQAK